MAQEQVPSGEMARDVATSLIHTYFTTQLNPLTRHHMDSYDQFIEKDLPLLLTSSNPLINLKDRIETSNKYQYRLEVFVGGEDGKGIYIGTPTLSLDNGTTVALSSIVGVTNFQYAYSIDIRHSKGFQQI